MWARKLTNDLPPPKKLVPALSEGIDRAIRRAMSTEPERRHANCGEFVEDVMDGGTYAVHLDSVEQAGDETLLKPAPLPVHRSEAGSSVGIDTSLAFKQPAQIDRYESDDAAFSLLTSVAVTLVVVVGFLSGLFLFAR